MGSIGGSNPGSVRTETARHCRVFVSYARADEQYRMRLDVHLAPLVREGLIEVWSDRAVAAGADWERDILHELATADIVILLVTPDFVASTYCFEVELPEALRRGACVLPVHVKSVDLPNLPFGRIQGLPTERRPISAWPDADEAWLRVAQGVRATAQEILQYIPRPRVESADKSRLGKELQDYYGDDNCVIDGLTSDVEWIPLNEDIDDLRFDNLVPVGRRHRTYATGIPQRAGFRFGIDLVAENLFHSARRHLYAGRPALAYGCARLGDVLAVHHPRAFEAHDGDDWAFLAQSLFYLPYRMHPALLDATLGRVRERLAGDRHCAGRATLLLAVANLYQDAGDWAKAETLYEAVLASDPAPFLHAAAVRRRAVGRIFLDHPPDDDVGEADTARLRFVRRLTGLRPVFTEYVAPATSPAYHSPELDATAEALLTAHDTTVAGRPVWVD